MGSHYLTRATSSPTSDPGKEVMGLSFVLCPLSGVRCPMSELGRSSVDNLPAIMPMRIPSQISVDCKSVH